MFSDAISSISCRCRPSSPRIAAAISGSAWSSVAVKNESGAEAVLALEDVELMGEISPPPQPVRRIAVGHGWRSEAVLAGYHIGPEWPSACGTRPVLMQDMVATGWEQGTPTRRPQVNSSFRDAPQGADPESRDSGFDAAHRPGT